ncbi:MAG: hypothetical protein JXA95_08750 [Spirochaetales bacterium]|nr:hypothetical protein [Spirochaetales bacterium]
MRKRLLLIPLLLSFSPILFAGEDHFSGLNDAQKLALSEAYQAVGEHFIQTGEEDRGRSYERTADVLRNQIADLSEAAREMQKNQQQAAYTSPAAPAVTKVSDEDQKAVGYYFRKLVRALLAENKDKVLSLLDNPLAMEGYLAGVPREKIEADLDTIFSAYDLTIYDMEDLYNMEDLSFSYRDSQSEDTVIVEAKAAFSGAGTPLDKVIFWKDVQKFYFKRAPKGWIVFAIL